VKGTTLVHDEILSGPLVTRATCSWDFVVIVMARRLFIGGPLRWDSDSRRPGIALVHFTSRSSSELVMATVLVAMAGIEAVFFSK
jgi:hypothetical protein